MSLYVFKPYADIFPKLFEEEKSRLLTYLKRPYQIEHVGSTAVPNLGGKGVIDICIVVPQEDREEVWKAFEQAGYQLRENFTPDMHVSHTIILPDSVETKRKYQIHIQQPNSQWLKEALAFRDYLRNHPEDVKRYEEIKQKAADESSQEREKYLAIKSPVIHNILAKALKEQT